MIDGEVKELTDVQGLPVGEYGEDGFWRRVGRPIVDFKNKICTRITLTQDLPGLHCNMRQVNVYVGDNILYEQLPLTSCEGITYKIEELDDAVE